MKITFVVPDGLTIRGGSKRVVEYASRLGKRGHDVYILGSDTKMPDWLGPYYEGFKLADIGKGYKDFKSDVAIATGGRAARRLGRMDKVKVKAYSVVMLESLNKPTEKHGKKIDRDRFLADPYDQNWIYYANSTWMKDVVETKFGQKCHLVLAPSNERMKPTKSMRPEDKLWVLGYGGESSWKGGHRTAEAVEIAKRTLPNIEMIHYAQRSCPKNPIVAQHWSNPRQDMLPQIYSSADVFVHSSKFEGFANAPFEAMSCGTPVISYKTSGIEDFITHNETGIIIDQMDINKMANTIVELLDDSERLIRLSENGLKKVSEFSWDKTLSMLEAIFEEALRCQA